MPCRDYTVEDLERSEKLSAQRKLEESRNLNDRLTSMLCYVVSKALEHEVDGYVLNYETREWYAAHRQADLDNMVELMENVNLDAIPKDDFDVLDALLSKYQKS